MADLQVHHLNGIRQDLATLARVTEVVSNQVDAVQTQQAEMDSRLMTLATSFEAFVRADMLAKELNLAETRLTNVRAELDSEYGHYGDVRRRTTGVLQALDTGIVSHETIQDTTEEVMVASPRYWLAPALVALAAWSRHDRELANNALTEALRRDVAKTSLFMSLVLRRYRRPAAARWLAQFFARQDPTALGREFIVVLDAVATGAYGIEGRAIATTEINAWLDELQHRDGFFDDQVKRWRDALYALRPTGAGNDYPHLKASSPTWDDLQAALDSAYLHAKVTAHFTAIFDGELRLPATLEAEMDEMLDRLVKEFDTEELPLRQREAELQAVIDHGGDKVAAVASAAQATSALRETVDFPSLLTNAAMRPRETGASRGSERLSVALSREWIIRAYDEITVAARDAVPESVGLTIEGWSGSVVQDTDDRALAEGLGGHIDRETQAEVDAVRFTGLPLAAAVTGGVLLVIGLVTLTVVVILLALGLAGYAAWDYLQLESRRQAARTRGEDRKRRALEQLNAALAELVDYGTEWDSQDDNAEHARNMLVDISPVEQLSVSAHQTREVL
jgi:hypothetical protein